MQAGQRGVGKAWVPRVGSVSSTLDHVLKAPLSLALVVFTAVQLYFSLVVVFLFYYFDDARSKKSMASVSQQQI